MRKIVGPRASRGEHAHNVTLLLTLEHDLSLPFKAEILVTAVAN